MAGGNRELYEWGLRYSKELSVIYRDGENLLLTHFCNAGNQPRLRLSHRSEAKCDQRLSTPRDSESKTVFFWHLPQCAQFRKLHVTAPRTEDTINKVFTEVAEGLPLVHNLPENISPPTIDDLAIAPGA